MTGTKTVLKKMALFFFALLFAASTFPVGREGEGPAVSLPIFAMARAAALATEDPASADAALQAQYDAAQALYDAAEYEKAYEAFRALGTFSDSRARASDSKKKWTAAIYKEAVTLFKAEEYAKAKPLFESLGSYKESRSYFYECNITLLRASYKEAKELFDAGDYPGAQAAFEALGGFRDSKERAQAAADQIKAQEQAKLDLTFYEKAVALKEAGDLEGARDAFIEAGDCKDATEQLYTMIPELTMRATYKRADGYYARGQYEEAYDWFLALGEYQDSAEKAALAKEAWQASLYEQATAMQSDDPTRAYILFLFLGEYKDSAALAGGLQSATTERNVYTMANALEEERAYALAKCGFEAISTYKNSKKRIAQASENVENLQAFKQAFFLRAIGKEAEANAILKKLGYFHDSNKLIVPVNPQFSTKHLRDDRTSAMSSVFTAPDGSKHRYRIYKGVHTWIQAKAFCEVLGGHLATMTTPEENAFVNDFMHGNKDLTAYFGLSDLARKGNWEWVTGEPFVYRNWHRGEPNRGIHHGWWLEKYGMYLHKYTDGTWNDSHFYENSKVDPGCSFICEWDD